jgi:uncharacterized membrane protein
MNYFYNFVIFHVDRNFSGTFLQRDWFTMYTVKDDHEYDDKSFAFVASRLVVAERCMLFQSTEITQVVVYEHEFDYWYDGNTITHTLLASQLIYGNNFQAIRGVRPGACRDSFVGLQWERNSKTGKSFSSVFPACVGDDDARYMPTARGDKMGIVVNDKGPLQWRCWPLYAQQLATMTQIQDEFSIDRFGGFTIFEPHTSGRQFGHVVEMSAIRRRAKNIRYEAYWHEEIMITARKRVQRCLYEYNREFTAFNHTWGDGNLPGMAFTMHDFARLASLWFPLMHALGYDVNGGEYDELFEDWRYDEYYQFPAFGSLKWKLHSYEIDHTLRALFNGWQWLDYYYGKNPYGPRFGAGFGYWRQQVWNDPDAAKAAIYDDWNNLTETWFRIIDCVNVLSLILVLDEPKQPRGALGKTTYNKLSTIVRPKVSWPPNVPFMPFLEVYPLPREPYLTTPEPPPIIDTPEIETITITDSGKVKDWYMEDDENEAYSIIESVRIALAKLEFLRRWTAKIRKQMPWYRNVPIEKIPPANDDAINPITDRVAPNPNDQFKIRGIS